MTITVDEEVARWAKVWAARHDTSVSRMVGELLKERMFRERSYEAAMKIYLEASATVLKQKGAYPRREELHDRKSLRRQ